MKLITSNSMMTSLSDLFTFTLMFFKMILLNTHATRKLSPDVEGGEGGELSKRGREGESSLSAKLVAAAERRARG